VEFNHETYDVTSNLLKGSGVIVIQHPAGKPKKIAKTNCLIEDVPVDGRREDSDFAHSCDTEGGSSGSRVSDTNGRLVGLHHYGFDEGGIWSRNSAITLSVIAADLKTRGITFASLASGEPSP
jgi:V8-like Glu-specific endopeptidase